MDLKTFDLDAFLREADAALNVGAGLAALGGPAAVTAVKIAQAIDEAVIALRPTPTWLSRSPRPTRRRSSTRYSRASML